MKRKGLFVAVSGIGFLACLAVALGDGGMFFRQISYQDVLQPTQKVYIRWDGSQEKLLIQTKYQGPAEEMVWIVPVPAEPAVETGDGAIFEELSGKTSWPDIAHGALGSQWRRYPWDLPLLSSGVVSHGGATSVVQWHRQVGDYDVVLLRPVDGNDAIQWLNSNGFTIPDNAIPILEDYIRARWWMVASRIHADALSDITREKLADGTLHPLDMTFSSSACIYPLRLTSMAVGPVEELIYIEGPTHYMPQTLAEGDWRIDIFGGSIRQVPQYCYESDVELTIDTINGRTKARTEPYLTKLRRVFQPEEMTQDLVFVPLDYSKWLESAEGPLSGQPGTQDMRRPDGSESALRVGLAATQYGRSRDPNGVPYLVKALSSGLLKQVQPGYYQQWPSPAARILSADARSHWGAYQVIDHVDGSESLCPVGNHVFSSIWALGEIAVDHRLGSEVEELLLECARHDNQLVRREAYLALMKLHSEKLGPILADRLAYMPEDGPVLDAMYDDIPGLAYEMNTVADWIIRFGTALQKEALTNALARPLAKLTGPSKYAYLGPQHEKPAVSDWFEWVVWRAAGTQDARLLAPLQDLYTRLARANAAESALGFVQRALAACGSAEATETLVRQIDDDESRVLAVGGAPTVESMTSLGSLDLAVHFGYPSKSLRVQILQQQRCRYEFYPMPSEAGDRALRSALSEKASDDWYALYLLAEIKEPQSGDRDRLMRIWESGDLWLRVVVADVLYAWADGQMLLSLYERTESDEIESEIAWALADLRVAEAVPIIEERIVNSWNRDWLSFSRAFLMWTSLDDAAMDDPKAADAMRKAEAVQRYFHPAWEDLDEERLAALKRLGENSTIHPGLRFELFATDYATKDWAKPLFRKSLRELLEAYPHSATVNQLVSQIDARLVVDACGASDSDAFRRNLLINLLAGGSVYNLAVVEGLLWEVWPQRYRETQGQSILFREPGELMASLDYYCQHAQRAIHGLRPGSGIFTYRPVEPALQSIVQDDSLPTGYRAFLLAYWQTAPGWFLREYVENLLEEDMPDFIRAALQMRLLDWQYSLEKVTF